MSQEIDQNKIFSASASLHSGGVLCGAASNQIYTYFESETGLPISKLFPAGFIASSVNSIAAVSFGLGYTATEYTEMFDRGAKAFSPPHVEKPSNAQIMRQAKSVLAHKLSTSMLSRFIPQGLHDLAQNPLMDTSEFDAILYEYLNGHTLKDLDVSVIIGAGLVTDNIRDITYEFSRVAHHNGDILFSADDHKDISLINIIKASSAIPGIIKGHYIPELKKMFNDNGHMMDFAHSSMQLHDAHDPSFAPLHVCLGRINYSLDATISAVESYNKHNILHHVIKTYKPTTCAHNFNNQLRILRKLYDPENVIDLSIYIDPKRYPSDVIPVDDMLLNSTEQRRRISALIDFEIATHHDTYARIVDRLGENAHRVQKSIDIGSYDSKPTLIADQPASKWSARAAAGLRSWLKFGAHGQRAPSTALH